MNNVLLSIPPKVTLHGRSGESPESLKRWLEARAGNG